jgi:CrcB protein
MTQLSGSALRLHLLIGTGLCGALTSYSTFSYEALQLAAAGARLYAVANLVLTLTCGLGAYYVGGFAARAIWG